MKHNTAKYLAVLLLLLCSVSAHAQQELLLVKKFPQRINIDTAYAPFYYGVTSGDPLQDAVIIWTRISPETPNDSIAVFWEMASDMAFEHPVNSGTYTATSTHDWTVKVDAGGLQPGNTYYYRFTAPNGKASRIGRAKTLPKDDVKHIRLAIASCSSIFSGYMNAYSRIGERNDIDFMIHLGDYIYDYVDDDEKVRVPEPYPTEPQNLQEYRERHKYYIADQDLRYARQQQTWIATWDNHDIDPGDKPGMPAAKQAFFEYLPIREQDPNDPYRIYRYFKMGNLADLLMMDEDSYVDRHPGDTARHTFIGHPQLNWLLGTLEGSKTKWHVLGSQKMMGSWYSKGLPAASKLPGDGTFFDPGEWDGFHDERDKIFNFMKDNKIDNNIVISGDLHMSFAINLTTQPFNRKVYKRSTGKGSVGVEFLPTSISRGNFDEQGIPTSVIPTAQTLSKQANPHHVYCDFTQHGYGILDITEERSIAEFWYVRKDIITDKQNFGVGVEVEDGENRWEWQMLAYPTK